MAPGRWHCPCFQAETDDITVLEYSHFNLEDVPNEVFNFERTLEELFLDANQIKDLPRPLFHCHGLRKLILSDNEIQSLPPAIASLINLEELDISKNGILEIPDNINGCKRLTSIEASVNPLGRLPEGFTQLINLEELYLNDTFLEYLPANFGRLCHLRILELRENHLKVLPKSISRLTELTRLDIGQNDFVELPEVIGSLLKLAELWCDGNRIVKIPGCLGNLKKLVYLDASKNKIQELAAEIDGCLSMTDLTLSNNKIRQLPQSIGFLKHMSVLHIENNQLISIPPSIGNLQCLEELVMSSNTVHTLPTSFGLLRNLHTFLADDNCIEYLPKEIGSCINLSILSLRNNRLFSIPDELGHITHLKVVNLVRNHLRNLPFSIAKLPNLHALWLSENQAKPLIPLQGDVDPTTGKRVLTCFMLPQSPLEDHEVEPTTPDSEGGRDGRQQIKFSSDVEAECPGKLVRAPTPYPKELKAHARHARNFVLKKLESNDSYMQYPDLNEKSPIQELSNHFYHGEPVSSKVSKHEPNRCSRNSSLAYSSDVSSQLPLEKNTFDNLRIDPVDHVDHIWEQNFAGNEHIESKCENKLSVSHIPKAILKQSQASIVSSQNCLEHSQGGIEYRSDNFQTAQLTSTHKLISSVPPLVCRAYPLSRSSPNTESKYSSIAEEGRQSPAFVEIAHAPNSQSHHSQSITSSILNHRPFPVKDPSPNNFGDGMKLHSESDYQGGLRRTKLNACSGIAWYTGCNQEFQLEPGRDQELLPSPNTYRENQGNLVSSMHNGSDHNRWSYQSLENG